MVHFFVAVFFAFLAPTVHGIETSPYCYRGKVSWVKEGKTTGQSEVYLEFSKIERFQGSGTLAFVEAFRLGAYSIPSSGTLRPDSTMIFNQNDDYIPGGNATYNRDVFLDFSNSNRIKGHFRAIQYPRGDGYGGYGSQSEGNLEATGLIELKPCKKVIVDVEL